MVAIEVVQWIAIIFFVSITIILGYAFYLNSKTRTADANVGINPYCIYQVCSDDDPFKLSAEEDPIGETNRTLTFCTVNGPPCEFIKAVNNGSNEVTNDQIIEVLDFYANEYQPRCKYLLGGGTTTVNPKGPANPNVNSTTMAFGPNDNFLVSLLSLANKRGLSNNQNYQKLVTECGILCKNL